MALFLDRVLGWLGLRDRRRYSTHPPAMHKPPRLSEAWQSGQRSKAPRVLPRVPKPIGDNEDTPADATNPGFKRPPRVPHHARRRPPKIDRGKP